MQSQYNINISGSALGKLRYFISGSYVNQGTLLKHQDIFEKNYGVKSKFDRYNFRSNVDLDATSMLNIRIDLPDDWKLVLDLVVIFLMCLVLLQRVHRLLNRYLIRMEHWELVAPLNSFSAEPLWHCYSEWLLHQAYKCDVRNIVGKT